METVVETSDTSETVMGFVVKSSVTLVTTVTDVETVVNLVTLEKSIVPLRL